MGRKSFNKNNFYSDLRSGQTVEEEVYEILKNKYRGYFYDIEHDPNWKEKGYDIKGKFDMLDYVIDVFFEVKHDKLSDRTNFVAVEFMFNGKKSGIATTTSHYYVYKLNNNFYIVSTKILKIVLLA